MWAVNFSVLAGVGPPRFGKGAALMSGTPARGACGASSMRPQSALLIEDIFRPGQIFLTAFQFIRWRLGLGNWNKNFGAILE